MCDLHDVMPEPLAEDEFVLDIPLIRQFVGATRREGRACGHAPRRPPSRGSRARLPDEVGSVPDLAIEESTQHYEPLEPGRVLFHADDFVAEIDLDREGIVRRYVGLAERVA